MVLAPRRTPDLFVVDRYISAAESAGVKPILVLNKCELEVDEALRAELNAFTDTGYQILSCSVRAGLGIEDLLTGTEAVRREGMDRLHQMIRRLRR